MKSWHCTMVRMVSSPEKERRRCQGTPKVAELNARQPEVRNTVLYSQQQLITLLPVRSAAPFLHFPGVFSRRGSLFYSRSDDLRTLSKEAIRSWSEVNSELILLYFPAITIHYAAKPWLLPARLHSAPALCPGCQAVVHACALSLSGSCSVTIDRSSRK